MLKKSFYDDTWLKQAADRVPEDMVFTLECWDRILEEILAAMKYYSNIAIDVLKEHFVFQFNRV